MAASRDSVAKFISNKIFSRWKQAYRWKHGVYHYTDFGGKFILVL